MLCWPGGYLYKNANWAKLLSQLTTLYLGAWYFSGLPGETAKSQCKTEVLAPKLLNQLFLSLCVVICNSPEFWGTDTQVPAPEHHVIMFVKKASLWSWTTHVPLSSFTQSALDKCTFSSFIDFALLIWVFDLLSAAPVFCSLPFFLDKLQYYSTVWMMNQEKIKRQRTALILQTWASLSSPNKG